MSCAAHARAACGKWERETGGGGDGTAMLRGGGAAAAARVSPVVILTENWGVPREVARQLEPVLGYVRRDFIDEWCALACARVCECARARMRECVMFERVRVRARAWILCFSF